MYIHINVCSKLFVLSTSGEVSAKTELQARRRRTGAPAELLGGIGIGNGICSIGIGNGTLSVGNGIVHGGNGMLSVGIGRGSVQPQRALQGGRAAGTENKGLQLRVERHIAIIVSIINICL